MATRSATRRRGRLRQMASGRWQAAYNGPDARVHYCPTGTFANKEYAEGWIANELRLIELDAWTPPDVREAAKYAGSVTVEEYVATWVASREIRETTRRTYTTSLEHHIKGSAIAAVTVKHLTRAQVTGWWRDLDKATPRARSKAYGLLRSALNAAVDEELIEVNPARVKDRKAVTSSTVRKLTPIEPEQLDVLAANVTDRRRLLVLLAAWGGLRYGELVALRRGDVDLRGDFPVLHVSRSVTFLTGQAPIAGPPKTDAGVRDVTLPSALKAVIAQHLLTFTQSGDDGLLFPGNKGGGYLWPSVFHKEWRKAREASGLPTLRVHDLRHASAVWALQTGESFSGVQARLGHSTPQAALRYQHAASGADGRIAKGLDAMRTTTTQCTPAAAGIQASSAS